MAAPVKLVDPISGMAATVTEFGQLVTAPVDYSQISQQSGLVNDQAYNLAVPTQGQQIVVTSIILTGGRDIGSTGATVDLYLATSPDATTFTPEDAVFSLELVKNGQLVLNNLNLITEAGKWINFKTDDNTVYCTILYYRVPV
jgi:hypothetical protein